MTENVKVSGVNCKPRIDPYHRDTGGLTITVLYIDPREKECWIDQEFDDSMVDESVWNGRILNPILINFLDNEKAQEFLLSERGQFLLNQVCNGHDIYWNGNNHIGVCSTPALDALSTLCFEVECFKSDKEYWTCAEWTAQSTTEELGITASSTHEELVELAWQLQPSHPITLIDNMLDYLITLRDRLTD